MKNKTKIKIFFCATEQSGDNLGEKIIKKIQNNSKIYNFDGVGGSKMKELLNKQFYSLKVFKSIGIIEILTSVRKYLLMIDKLANIIIKNNYQIVVTIDSPDFNFRLAKKIKQKGYKGKIVHIVAPSVWAWRKNRAKDISLIYDKLLVIFPFEPKYFTQHKLNTKFIGNPIYYIKDFNKKRKKEFIAFLPGSRKGEIKNLINYFKILSEYLYNISSKYKLFIPTLPHIKKDLIILTKNWKIKPLIIIDQKEIDAYFSKTLFAVVCSGTATLEITKRKIPQIIIYKLNILTVIILYLFAYIKYANIINIMANQMIIPEIVNFKLNNKNILIEFKKLLNDNNNAQIKNSRYYITKLILKKSPAEIASKEIKKLLFP